VFSRSVAWLLILLAASPFTAPFSTCDPSILLTTAQQPPGQAFIERSASIENGAAQSPAVSFLDEDQFKKVSLTATAIAVFVFVDAVRVSASVPRTSVVRPPLLTLRL
jgi:hypothetical protein